MLYFVNVRYKCTVVRCGLCVFEMKYRTALRSACSYVLHVVFEGTIIVNV